VALAVSAREEVLGRIRAALGDARGAAVEVPRGYRRTETAPREQLVELFAERVADYRATVLRTALPDLPAALAAACRELGVHRLVVPSDLPEHWRPGDVDLVPDDGLSIEQIDAADGVLTGCAVAIAETGTIVLDCGPAQGRRALTLVPDVHLCIVNAAQIVGLVPEALARLDPARPITFISGPSATSDIELSRVEGVHGPRTLVVAVAD
jgi:L-lactate dehydrogenase complex protein LldG